MIGIYKIENLINGKVYIGQSIDIIKRWQSHKNCIEDKPLYRAFKKYGLKNFDFSVIEECSSDELNDKERFWISYYHSCIYDENNWGYNLSYGGEGCSIISLEQQKIILQLWDEGKTTTQIAKIMNYSVPTITSHLKNYKSYTLIERIERGKKAHVFGKKVNVYDINGNLINKYEQLQLAAKDLKISYGSAKRIVKGIHTESCNHYILIYEDEDQEKVLRERLNNINNKYKSKKKPIQQIDINTNEVIKDFSSIKEAALEILGKEKASLISACCKGQRKTAYGYRWRYKK